MGKRIISQRRGRGTSTYKSPSFRFSGKVKYRNYDKIEKEDLILGKVLDLIHCPGHSAPLAVIRFGNEDVLNFANNKLRKGQIISSGKKSEAKMGNILPLEKIPIGKNIFNVEKSPGDGGKFIRASGSSAKIDSKSKEKVTILFPSKKKKILSKNCRATVGIIAGGGRKEKPFVKAGKRYHAMKAKNKLYPLTSGVAMNAVDHPFGSGRGRHVGKPKTAPRFAPPGRKVGLIKAKKTGKKR